MNRRIYISYVIQGSESHSHHFEIVTVSPAQITVYSDNTSQRVLEWAQMKQGEMTADETIVIQNFFSILNYQ